MTGLLDRARTLPPEMQDELMLDAGDTELLRSARSGKRDRFAQAETEANRGEFATDEDMQTITAKQGR